MEKILRIPRVLLLCGILVPVLIAWALGGMGYLWVFPLDGTLSGFALWLVISTLDVAAFDLLRPYAFVGRARLLLWVGGLLYFTAAQGSPEVGLCAAFLPALLWVLSREGKGRVVLPLLAGVAFFAGHWSETIHPGLAFKLDQFRFSLHVFLLFFFWRAASFYIATYKRGERPGFLVTMEYFLAPAFWLSPPHAAVMSWGRMSARRADDPGLLPLLWILRGFVTAVAFSLVYRWLGPWLHGVYEGGWSRVAWWHFFAVGAAAFVLTYLEKARVSYVAAGFLRLVGHDVEPDFRSPWLARSLLEYWRRFHYWVLEFYLDNLYGPLSARLARSRSPQSALALALFLTFSVATSLNHFLAYPGGVGACFLLGVSFGVLTLLHFFVRETLESRAWLGIPVTWCSVFLLYVFSFPVFGLGWGIDELTAFFGR